MLWNVYIDNLADMLNGEEPVPYPPSLFFADDIKLQLMGSAAHQAAQDSLDLITQWCHGHNMTPGIKKCGIVLPHEVVNPGFRTLQLNGDTLPVVKVYKYLGFEVTKNGIDWAQYYDRAVKKAKGILAFSKKVSFHWKPSLRVAAYKTFIRSVLEYGAAIFYHWAMLNPKPSKQLWQALESVQSEAIAWIFNTTRVTRTHSSLAGIIPLQARFEHLATTLTLHLNNAPNFHPTKIMIGQEKPKNNTLSLVNHCSSTPTLVEYQKYLEEDPREPVSLRAFVKKAAKNMLLLKSGSMASYCNALGRTAGGTDHVLQINDNALRAKALMWRLNRCYTIQCKCGKSNMSRSHIGDCEILHNAPIPIGRLERYAKRANTPATKIMKQLGECHYTILDQILNDRCFKDFEKIWNHLVKDLADKDNAQQAEAIQQDPEAMEIDHLLQQQQPIHEEHLTEPLQDEEDADWQNIDMLLNALDDLSQASADDQEMVNAILSFSENDGKCQFKHHFH
jgi:hypothetical protein